MVSINQFLVIRCCGNVTVMSQESAIFHLTQLLTYPCQMLFIMEPFIMIAIIHIPMSDTVDHGTVYHDCNVVWYSIWRNYSHTHVRYCLSWYCLSWYSMWRIYSHTHVRYCLSWYRLSWSGKKLKSVFDFLTYLRKTGFSFSYEKVEGLLRAIGSSNKIDRVSKFDNSLSFGAKQNALQQIFLPLWFFKDLFT